jgi:N-acetylglucosaminyl-diphospho-decaprenol L-rhamnosyltransferase
MEDPTGRPEVTVVVVTWDGLDVLPACLASVRAQQGVEVRLVVVDNASTDGTREWLRAHEPAAEVVDAGANLGFAGGAALGVAVTSTPYVAVLNNDATADPGWLAAQVAVLAAPGNERVAAVTPRVLLAGRTLVNSTGNEMTRAGRGRDRDWRQPATSTRPAGEVFGFCGTGALLRRAAVDEVGGFDPSLFLYYEDTDLSWRLRAAGWKVWYEPGSVVEHRHAVSSGEGSPRFTLWNERNSLVVFTRHAPAHLVLAAHLRRLVGLVLHTVRAPASPVTRARWRAMGQHLHRLPGTLRDRRRTWAGAIVSRRDVADLLAPSPAFATSRRLVTVSGSRGQTF